jgi:hypothetical protein
MGSFRADAAKKISSIKRAATGGHILRIARMTEGAELL